MNNYDIDGNPISMEEAARLTSDIEARRIGLDHIGDYEVSTVHLADAFQLTHDGRPLMFETMVSGRTDQSERIWRTTTKELAKQQHEWLCHVVRQESKGLCPHSGVTFRDCKSSDLCDCFDYPEHEHYRAEDDEERAELADLLGADMVEKLLADEPNRGEV